MDDNTKNMLSKIKTKLDSRQFAKQQGNYFICPVCGNMMSYYNKKNLLCCPRCGKMDSFNLLSLSMGLTSVPYGADFFKVIRKGCEKIGEPYVDGRALAWDAVIDWD